MLIAAGCNEATTTPIAETLGPTAGTGAVALQDGFGQLPQLPKKNSNNYNGIVKINTTLPTLPDKILVARTSGSGLDLTQFQNLSHAIGIPIGMLGTKPINTKFSFSWQNNENYLWNFDSTNYSLNFVKTNYNKNLSTVSSWPEQKTIDELVTSFLTGVGYDVLSIQNISIQQDWLDWKLNTNDSQNCLSEKLYNDLLAINSLEDIFNINPQLDTYVQSPCKTNQLPNYLPITFERVVDQRNIVNSIGRPEIGGSLIYDLKTKEFVFGWFTMPKQIQRSEYSAISEKQMKTDLEQGGLGGTPQGTVDIDEVFFSFISPEKQNTYDYDFLIPALVGQGTQTIDDSTNPYRIVVPLVKQ